MMITEIIKNYGRLDILVNNAGIVKDNLLMRMKETDFDAVTNINLKGTFNCIQNVARYMLKQKYGRMINISSVVGIYGNAGQANYAASKAGIIGMTKSAAKELGSRGITVNAIAPGFIQTEMTDALSDELKEKMLDAISVGCFGTVEDIAHTAAFLASDKARYITGQVISVDGGISM
jgi:3-oxoacyl-[acyl-carrier protein] reductase